MVSTQIPQIENTDLRLQVIPFGLEMLVERLISKLPQDQANELRRRLESTESAVYVPLLRASGGKTLEHKFLEVWPYFATIYIDACVALWEKERKRLLGYLAQVPTELETTVVRSSAELGESEANKLSLGLHAIATVSRAYAQSISQEGVWKTLETKPKQDLIQYILAYSMVMATVSYYIFHFSRIEREPKLASKARRNARTLASWSYGFAMRAYQAAEEADLLKVPSPPGVVPTLNEVKTWGLGQSEDNACRQAA